MGHKNIDLDAYGSLLGLYEICTHLRKKTFLFMNKDVNDSVTKALKLENKESIHIYELDDFNSKDLLIIADTNKETLVESSSLLKKIPRKIVIDHHIKDEPIKNTIVSYVLETSSSASEMVLNYALYLRKKLSSITATIMLAGLEIDTNSYEIRTTPKTYETAANLLKMGADISLKKDLLKQSKEEYIRRQKLLKHTYMLDNKTAICVFDQKIYKKEDLAIIANELLQFDNVKAGYAIGKIDAKLIGISAKSLGNVNVEKVINKLGGGGHINNAATQIESNNLKEVEKKLTQIIKE